MATLHFPAVLPVVPEGLDVELPALAPLRQRFPEVRVGDPAAATRRALSRLRLPDLKGRSVAITAGSRGIPHVAVIVRELVSVLRGAGAEPFVVPAMGSHGAASAEGQAQVLADYGITEATVGAPVRSSLETVVTGRLPDGTPVYTDRLAAQADGIVVFNKVKPHTSFKATHESGLAKMLVIGLGKHDGARTMHNYELTEMGRLLPTAAGVVLGSLPVLFGLAVVENAWGELAIVEAVEVGRLLEREAELLTEAKRLMGRLLMPRVDVLVVDRIGKNISGTGMDPNVTGRPSWPAPGFPNVGIQKIIVRGLTEETHGNAAGIGNADFTTVRCVADIDLVATYTNVFSARVMQAAKLPVVLPNDRLALSGALVTLNHVSPGEARVVRVRDTKHLDTVWASKTVVEDVADRGDLELAGGFAPLMFDAEGYLVD